MTSLEDLFHALLQELYSAEEQLLKALPKFARRSSNPKLSRALTDHESETEGHLQRLEQVFEMIGRPAAGSGCEGVAAIIAKGEAIVSEASVHTVRDAGMLAAVQATEHYEIASHGTLVAWAELLNESHAVRLLRQTLDEEKKADLLLTEIANGSVNEAAQMA